MATTKKTSKISAVIPAVDPTPSTAPLNSVDQDLAEDGAHEATALDAAEASTMIRKKDFIPRLTIKSSSLAFLIEDVTHHSNGSTKHKESIQHFC